MKRLLNKELVKYLNFKKNIKASYNKSLTKFADEEKFNAKQMKFLHEMMDSQLFSNEFMKYVGENLNDEVIKYFRLLMEDGYGDEDLYKMILYIIKQGTLKGRKMDLFIDYITHRKTTVDEEQAFNWYNFNKDVDYDKLSNENFRIVYNGGMLNKIYNASKVALSPDNMNELISICNNDFGSLNGDDEWTLINMMVVYLLGADGNHVELMKDIYLSYKDNEAFKYIRNELISKNKDINFIKFVCEYNLSINDIEYLEEYYDKNKNLDDIGKLLDSGLTVEESINYYIDNEDVNKYMNDYDNYTKEQDDIDEYENRNQHLRVSKKIKN